MTASTDRLHIPGLPWADSPETVGLGSARLARLSARLQRGVDTGEIPVSYTHLTLTTICSV